MPHFESDQTNLSDSQPHWEPHWLNENMLSELLAGKRVSRPDQCWSVELQALGLCGDEGFIWLRSDAQALQLSRLQIGLSSRAKRLWPNIECRPAIASTNSALMALEAEAATRLLTTEYQFGGRGRRGRRWLSPLGRNICVSVGFRFPGTIDRLGGLSLVVGLAIADALISLKVPDVQLKWPNDLVVMRDHDRYAKLGGILVELQSHPSYCVAVIGVGLNHGGAEYSRAGVDGALADVAELRPGLDRTDTMAAVVNALGDYLENFLAVGFAPMKQAWQSLHAFHNREIRVTFGDPDVGTRLTGKVVGVADSGQLLVQTANSEQIELDAGEVSLRPLT